MLSAPTLTCRGITLRMLWVTFFLGSLAMIGYGGFRVHNREHLSCPLPPSLQNKNFLATSIKMYASICNPSTPLVNAGFPSINVTSWCETLKCNKGMDASCLIYVTGSDQSNCPTNSSCALSCVTTVHGDFIAGIVLIVIGFLILVGAAGVCYWHYRKTGYWW